MIDRQEIMDFAHELGLSPEVVEKDYVLGWLLAGISQHEELARHWLFKGGTCLKKCFFETYRFSEDLDFTITEESHINESFLRTAFESVSHWVYDQCGIETPADTIMFEVYENPRGRPSVQGRVGYRGPLQRRGSVPRIKLDLTSDERIVLESVERDVHHPYTDKPAEGMKATCYRYEELFAEKLRALTERMRPRDLYDVIHFYRHDELSCDRPVVLSTLTEKCAFKGIPVPTYEALQARPERSALESEWENMLAHQLPELPPFAHFFEELPKVFDWLFGNEQKTVMAALPVGMDEDQTWRPPASVTAWGLGAPLEIIRFAAANRLCVELAYDGRQRLIEPYALRRTKEGNIILHAIRCDNGEHRSYRIAKIQGAKATDRSFVPRYTIELTGSGYQSIPPTTRSQKGTSGLGLAHHARSLRHSSRHGPRYIIQCPVCEKKFNRQSCDLRLNEHKNKSGLKCFGRTGHFVETKY